MYSNILNGHSGMGCKLRKKKIFSHTSWHVFSKRNKMDSSHSSFPVVTETYLHSWSPQQYVWDANFPTHGIFFYFLTFSFCWTNFCWIRASYKQKEVWFQGHSMSETDGSELNVLIYLFENCLNVLFSHHRAYYSTPMVSSWEMFRFVCFSPNMKIIEYQWLIHKKNKNKRSSTSTRDAITTRE